MIPQEPGADLPAGLGKFPGVVGRRCGSCWGPKAGGRYLGMILLHECSLRLQSCLGP